MYRRSKAQLNAISRSVTARERKKAEKELLEKYGIDFADFAKTMGYKGSPRALRNALNDKAVRTVAKVVEYMSRTGKEII